MNSVVTRDGVDREEMEIERLGGRGLVLGWCPSLDLLRRRASQSRCRRADPNLRGYVASCVPLGLAPKCYGDKTYDVFGLIC